MAGHGAFSQALQVDERGRRVGRRAASESVRGEEKRAGRHGPRWSLLSALQRTQGEARTSFGEGEARVKCAFLPGEGDSETEKEKREIFLLVSPQTREDYIVWWEIWQAANSESPFPERIGEF